MHTPKSVDPMLLFPEMELPAASAAILALLASTAIFANAEVRLEGCNGKRISVLDLDVFFRDESQGRPACYPMTLMVTPSNGKVYIHNKITKDATAHVAGAHAAAFYLADAIKKSEHYTTHLELADLIYVNDYCYWVWWLAWVNFGALSAIKPNIGDRTPGDFLVQAYETMMRTPRWLQSKGADFVFFDGHPGFYEGEAKHQIWPLRCGAMQHSVQILSGMPQRRRCLEFPKMKERLIIAPLMAPIMDANNVKAYTFDLDKFWAVAKLEHERQSRLLPFEQRKTLVYFKGRCDPHSKNSAGRRLRNYLARNIFTVPEEDVDVTCLEDHVKAAQLLESAAVYGEMRHSVFCLVLPGQEQATDAVARAFLAGCVPVFVGKPWHTIPLAEVVDYSSAAVFLALQDTQPFLSEGSDGNLSVSIGAHPQEARWWDADVSKDELDAFAHTLPSAEHILEELRKLKVNGEAQKKMAAVWKQRHRFQYVSFSDEVPGAIQSLMQGVCVRITGRKEVDWADGNSKLNSTSAVQNATPVHKF